MRVSLADITDKNAVKARREIGMERAVPLDGNSWIFVDSGDYQRRIAEFEAEGVNTSDAQALADAEMLAWYGASKERLL